MQSVVIHNDKLQNRFNALDDITIVEIIEWLSGLFGKVMNVNVVIAKSINSLSHTCKRLHNILKYMMKSGGKINFLFRRIVGSVAPYGYRNIVRITKMNNNVVVRARTGGNHNNTNTKGRRRLCRDGTLAPSFNIYKVLTGSYGIDLNATAIQIIERIQQITTRYRQNIPATAEMLKVITNHIETEVINIIVPAIGTYTGRRSSITAVKPLIYIYLKSELCRRVDLLWTIQGPRLPITLWNEELTVSIMYGRFVSLAHYLKNYFAQAVPADDPMHLKCAKVLYNMYKWTAGMHFMYEPAINYHLFMYLNSLGSIIVIIDEMINASYDTTILDQTMNAIAQNKTLCISTKNCFTRMRHACYARIIKIYRAIQLRYNSYDNRRSVVVHDDHVRMRSRSKGPNRHVGNPDLITLMNIVCKVKIRSRNNNVKPLLTMVAQHVLGEWDALKSHCRRMASINDLFRWLFITMGIRTQQIKCTSAYKRFIQFAVNNRFYLYAYDYFNMMYQNTTSNNDLSIYTTHRINQLLVSRKIALGLQVWTIRTITIRHNNAAIDQRANAPHIYESERTLLNCTKYYFNSVIPFDTVVNAIISYNNRFLYLQKKKFFADIVSIKYAKRGGTRVHKKQHKIQRGFEVMQRLNRLSQRNYTIEKWSMTRVPNYKKLATAMTIEEREYVIMYINMALRQHAGMLHKTR